MITASVGGCGSSFARQLCPEDTEPEFKDMTGVQP